MAIEYEQQTDELGQYLALYDEVAELETELKMLKKKKEEAKVAVIAHMSSLGLDSMGRGNRTVVATKRSFGKVTNFNALRRYVTSSDEPIVDYMEEVFIKGSSSNPRGIHLLVQEAQGKVVQGLSSMEDALPPGLEVATIDVVTVRKRTDKKPESIWSKLEEAVKSG